MKKLFALVLTLAMVFAIAAPAMAATWGAGTPAAGSPYVVKVTQLQKNTDLAGNPYYTAYPANLGVIANTPVYFQVDITVPSTTDLNAYYPNPTTAGTFGATVTVKNINTLAVAAEFVDGVAATVGDVATIDDGDIKLTSTNWATGGTAEKVYSAIITGIVTKTADATVTAAVGYSSAKALPLTKTVGGVVYTFAAPGATSATITGDNDTKLTLALTNDVVTGMTLTIGADAAAVDYIAQAGPTFLFYNSGTSAIEQLTAVSNPAAYAVVLAAYNAYTGMLGFSAGATGIYYTTANVLANFGYTNRATGTATYKAYNSSLTVTDGTSVPNTGDNMSVIGFVMVGLALLATAAVVVKKVRA